MSSSDLYSLHKKGKYPARTGTAIAIAAVIGIFLAVGFYAYLKLWDIYSPHIVDYLNLLGVALTSSQLLPIIILAVVAIAVLSTLLILAAAALARKLGGTLIYIGAGLMCAITLIIPLTTMLMAGMTVSQIGQAWPIFIPGLIVLFFTVLLVTVFKGRIRRADRIIKLTGKICLDEKGIFLPPLASMLFTVIAAIMAFGIYIAFTPMDVVLGNEPYTLETATPLAITSLVYIFLTLFVYKFAYATSSAMAYIYVRGGDPSLGEGVTAALRVAKGLAALAVIGTIVRVITSLIRSASRRGGPVGAAAGSLASGAIRFVWAAVNYFTIPVMVAEGKGVVDSIKKSARMLWENLVDVIIKETGVRWGFAVLSMLFFVGFPLVGGLLGWIATASLVHAFLLAVVFLVFASIPSTLMLRTFDIVYVTLLYAFIRQEKGEIKGKLGIPAAVHKDLASAYQRAVK